MKTKKQVSKDEAFITGSELVRTAIGWFLVLLIPTLFAIFLLKTDTFTFLAWFVTIGGTMAFVALFSSSWRKKHFFKELSYKNSRLYCKTFSGSKYVLPLKNIGPDVRIDENRRDSLDDLWKIPDRQKFWYVKDGNKYETWLPIEVADWLIKLKTRYQEEPDHPFGREVGANSSVDDIIHMRTLIGKVVMIGFTIVTIWLVYGIMEIIGLIDLI